MSAPPTKKGTRSDRKLLLTILAAQRDIAEILFKQNINHNSREAAGELHTQLSQFLEGDK